MSVRNTVKSIQDIMRQDSGVEGGNVLIAKEVTALGKLPFSEG